jgi:hypothetical protein
MCINKRRYLYKETALEMVQWKFFNENINLGIYRCPRCPFFHLTSRYCNTRYLHPLWETQRAFYSVTRESIKKKAKRDRVKHRKLTQSKPVEK